MKNSARLTIAKFIAAALFVTGSFNIASAALPGGLFPPGEEETIIKTEALPGSINLPGEEETVIKTAALPGSINLPGEEE